MSGFDDNTRASIEGLTRLLDIFGADRARWPARERLKYTGFIAENPEARRLVAETEALDKLLDAAPEPRAADLDALAARIMAAAGAKPGAGHGNIAPLKPRAAPLRRAETDRLMGWPAAALLAASLVLGVFVGSAGMVDEPMQSITDLASSAATSDAEDDASRLAFDSDDSGASEEEIL